MAKTADRLNERLVASLQGEKIVQLITMDKDTNLPNLSAVSWLLADPSGKTVNIAMGPKAASVENIRHNPHVVLGFFADGSYYALSGTASVSDTFERTMKLCVVTVEAEAVEDAIFYGGQVTVEPAYIKTYNPELAKKLDEEVYELLRQ
ncbi:pyridoxamine 5'-phosphate oxidase family protein [Cohnella candidum]|uniref:Pyridoxamine 5'-phosphate oxidase n=1 Tax=Cohnella candidum TaxID=2674991 RepID=A0A3G3JTM5_9BACL|nr:pyridoxamine 5'-phosphate oxidase family protein [Cohnella candidum]AYQ71566.1 pyridoxamine 5'-phosphate oxidase [Cohnella candidum]